MTGSDVSAYVPARRELLNSRARLLAWATIVYNAVEGAVAIVAGAAASSVALISFGLDSAIEVASAAALAWQFGARGDPEARERRTLRLIALSFFALAAYVTVEAIRNLAGAGTAEESIVGIALAAASLVVMPLLVWAKRRVGRELGSATVVADSTQTLLCTYLSAVLLGGLLLNALLGWTWADPLVALVIAAVAIREGVQAWRGDNCCTEPLTAATAADPEGGDGNAHACACAAGCTGPCCSHET